MFFIKEQKTAPVIDDGSCCSEEWALCSLGRLFAFLDFFVDFIPMDRDFSGSFDSHLDLIALDVDDQDGDFITDSDSFISFATQDQHVIPP